jgi:hypothetical protein
MDELEEQLKDSKQVIEKASNTLRKHFVLEQNC